MRMRIWILLIVAVFIVWLVTLVPGHRFSLSHRNTPTREKSRPLPGGLHTKTSSEAARAILDQYNQKNIEFYGKVVDQDGNPLGGVEVDGSIIYNSGAASGVLNPRTHTDANGYFEINGVSGRTLDFNLVKPGYRFMPERDAFDYTELVPPEKRHRPDPKHPVVLRMWRLHGAEPLVQFASRNFKLPADGSPVRIDLSTGRRVATGGDVVIRASYPTAQPGQRLEHFPWTVQVSVPGGGFAPGADPLMLLAPDSGYTEDLKWTETGREPRVYNRPQYFIGNGGAYQRYYLKTADGRYARIIIDLRIDTAPDRGGRVTLTWWLNPTPGHRNLEFDPAKAITPK